MEKSSDEKQFIPKVECTLEKEDVLVYSLCGAGWFNGNPSTVYNSPADEVIRAYHYVKFKRELQSEIDKLNRAKNK